MAQSRQTPRVWSDAIRGSEILANWVKMGASAVLLWLSIGIALGAAVGGFWFFEGTTSLDRRLWVHHVRNSLGIGGRIADLPDPNGSGTRIQVAKEQVQLVDELKKKGMEVLTPDLGPFRERIKSLDAQFPEYAPWLAKIRAL